MSVIILTGILAILILTLGLMAYSLYLRHRRKDTRDKYAFTALFATLSIVSLGVTSVSSIPPWAAVLRIIGHILNKPEMSPDPAHWAENALILIFCCFAIWILHRQFIHWEDRPISKRQYEQDRLHEQSHYLLEGVAEVKRLVKREPPSPVYEPAQHKLGGSMLTPPQVSFAWRDDARELLELRSQQYAFDPDDDWHERGSCWVGSDIKTGATIALMCPQETPSQEDVEIFVNYINSLPNVDVDRTEYIVAVREGDPPDPYKVNGQTISVEIEATLLEGLVDFSDYIMHIRKRVEKEHLPDSELTINSIYTPSQLLDSNRDDLATTLEKYISAWSSDSSQRQLAILGEYGQGKSTGTLMFTHKALTGEIEANSRIPILIELRGKSPSSLQPLELLGAWASAYRIDPKALEKLVINGKTILIFEGFDEMSNVSDLESRLAHFKALWQFCFPHAKIIFTGRPNFFLDDNELKTALGINDSAVSGPYCEHFHLKPFTIEQIEESLRWAQENTREEIIELGKRDAKLLEIISRPSLLYIVCRLWRSSDFEAITKSITAAKVMGEFIQHCYHRQTEKHRESAHFMVLTESERKYFMDGVVAYMSSRAYPNQISRPDFDELIIRLYNNMPEQLPEVSDVLAPEQYRPLKARIKDKEDAVEEIQTDVRTAGLLVRDYSKPDALKFPHKSFYEYLLGNHIAQWILNSRPEYSAAIKVSTGLFEAIITESTEALDFLTEILTEGESSKTDNIGLIDNMFNTIVRRTPLLKYFLPQRVILAISIDAYRRKLMLVDYCVAALTLSATLFLRNRADLSATFFGELLSLALLTTLLASMLFFPVLMNFHYPIRYSTEFWTTVSRRLISERAFVKFYGTQGERLLEQFRRS